MCRMSAHEAGWPWPSLQGSSEKRLRLGSWGVLCNKILLTGFTNGRGLLDLKRCFCTYVVVCTYSER
jgi:hypothetical protein